MFKCMLILAFSLLIAGCGDLFLRSMDEFSAGMGGQRTCQYEADYQTIYGDGYTYEFGGYCNQWLGTITNNSEYTIKCSHTLGGRAVNSIYAGPHQTTDKKFIAQMSNAYLNASCQRWERTEKLENRYSDTQYSVFSILSSGRWKMRLVNHASFTRNCRLLDSNKRVIQEQIIAGGQSTRWWTEPSGKFYTQCVS
ncbi:MAG: hypothetical protein OQJ80_04215 [Kangiella sp.]|nr:hypothetical protein [Kangiella sp.]